MGSGRALQGMPRTGNVQYSHPSLCTDPGVARAVGFDSRSVTLGRREHAVMSRGCLVHAPRSAGTP